MAKNFIFGSVFTLFCLAFVHSSPALAQGMTPSPRNGDDSPFHSISFSKLLVRPTGTHDIAIAPEEFRIMILEELRENGFNTYGAESLLFDQDDSNQARFILGGVINDIKCEEIRNRNKTPCDISVNWELFDRSINKVVYKVLTQRRRYTSEQTETLENAVHKLVLGALKSLLGRPLFKDALRKKQEKPKTTNYESASFSECNAPEISLPDDMEYILNASVIIRVNGDVGLGSGFFISSDGLVLTANHVVAGAEKLEVETRTGLKVPAVVLRADPQNDVALIQANLSGVACLGLNSDPPRIGSSIYTVGSPVGDDLAFSVSRGIVSGLREWKGHKFIQTDASINAGNSGGPFVDSTGRVVAIVSWKIAGLGVEGIGFGVPVAHTLAKLKIWSGKETTIESTRATPPEVSATNYPIVDKPDPHPEVLERRKAHLRYLEQQEKERQRQREQQEKERQWQQKLKQWEATAEPFRQQRRPYLKVAIPLTVAGPILLIAGGGLLGAAKTLNETADDRRDKWLSQTDPDRRDQYESEIDDLRKERDIKHGVGAALMATGAAAIVTSLAIYIVMPKLPEKPNRSSLFLDSKNSNITFETTVGINSFYMNVSF